MKHTVIRIATEHPRSVYIATLVLALVMGALMLRIEIDTDPENMLPATQDDRIFHNLVEERFTLHDAIVVGVVNDHHANGIFNVESLTALHTLSEAILKLDGVIAPDLMSLAETDNIGQAGPGTIRFEWMMQDAPVSREQALDIRDKVSRLPLLQDTLVSGDGKAAAIYVPIASKDLSYPLSQEIRQLTEGLSSTDTYHITGLPVAEDTFGHDMFIQMAISAPLAGLMIFLLMLYFFRSPQLVIAPMLVAMATVIISMGLLIGLGFTVHIMSSMIPIFLMPIAVVDSVHIMSEFADTYRADTDPKVTIAKVVEHLFTPMLFTSLTSAVGFLSLLLTPIPPVQIFGAFVAFGIVLAFLITILLIPAYVVRMKPAALAALVNRSKTPHSDTPLARALRGTGAFAMRNGKVITGVAVLFLAISTAGLLRIEINDNPVRWFKANHPIRVADKVLNEHFAGTYDAFVVLTNTNDKVIPEFIDTANTLVGSIPVDTIPGDATLNGISATDNASQNFLARLRALLATDPTEPSAWLGQIIATVDDALFETDEPATVEVLEQLMQRAEAAQMELKYFQTPAALEMITGIQNALMESGYVGKTNALPDVVKVVNRELHGGSPQDYRIPENANGVAQTLLQYQSSHRPQDLWHMVTPDLSSTAIWLQLKSGDNQDMSRVIAVLDEYLTRQPVPDNVEMRWAGKTFINVVWQDAMVSGMLKSLMGAFAMVFLMMALLFRNVRLGLLAMVPLSFTIVG
ncbi:MAG: MMPL family transporter, partial [Gammaproteobacteria bacterium]|nr:MMPL family transporter [Gammaproteobacteria bacterium]